MASELTDYARQELASGTSPELLRSKLKAQGWDDWTINTTLADAQRPEVTAVPEAVASMPVQPPAEVVPAIGEAAPAAAEIAPAGSEAAPSLVPDRAQVVRHRMLSAAILAAVIAILAGASAWGYYNYFPSPERILALMSERMAAVRSFHYQASVRAESQKNPFLAGQSVFDFAGDYDLTDPTQPKGRTLAGMEAEMFTFRLELVTLGKIMYVRLEKAPEMLKMAEGKWVKVDPAAMVRQMGMDIKEFEAKAEEQALDPEQARRLQELVARSKFIRIVEDHGVADLDGEKAYHFTFELDREGIAAFVTEASKILERNMSEQDVAKLTSGIMDADLPTGEIWIGRWDFLPRKLQVDWDMDGEKIGLTIAWSDFGKAFDWQEPAGAVPVEEITAQFFGALPSAPPGAMPTLPPVPAF